MAKSCTTFIYFSVIVQFLLFQSTFGKPDISLKAVPENQTLWATNFTGLLAIAEVVADLANPCNLTYFPDHTAFGSFTASNSTSTWEEVNITTIVVDGYVTAEITFNNPITSSFELAVSCYQGSSMGIFNVTSIIVSDCPSHFSTDVGVSFNETADYQRLGEFRCNDNDRELFHSSGHLLKATTVCQSDATWENQENVQCWKAAHIELNGTYQLKAGETIYLRCEYLDDGFPNGTNSIMFFGNHNTRLSKGDNYTRVVTWEDNKKEVYCQAETPFTKQFPESGKSHVKTIEIMYAPLLTTSESIVCEWHVNMSGLCLLNFISNPHVDEVYLFINGSTPALSEATTNLTSNGDEQIFHFLKEQVQKIDNGSYTLEVKSSTFPSNYLYIHFDIFVHEAPEVIPPQNQPSELPFIIGLSVMAAVLVVSAIVNIYLARSRMAGKKKAVNKNKDIAIPNRYATSTNAQVPNTEEAIYSEGNENIYDDNMAEQDIYADVI